MKFSLTSALILLFVALVLGGIFFWQPQIAIWLAAGLLLGAFITAFLFARSENKKELSGKTQIDKIQTTIEPVSQRALLKTVMNATREGIIVVGEDLRVLASNSAADRIFAGIAGSLERKRITELTRNLEIHDAFRLALEQGEQRQVKAETRGENKLVFDLRVAPLELSDENNPRRRAIGIFYEITRLERLENVRQEFLSNVSHELRTPLTSILAFVETLENGAINDAENNLRFLGVIRKNAQRMNRLINDILELSAIESGKIKIKPHPVKLAPIVEDIVTNLKNKAAARNVTVENKIPANATVFADAERLEQMLTNLIDNAVKFNLPDGRVTIDFETGDGRDRISVTDTGEGIAPEHAERIFERFYRVDRARSRDIGGTGLGLSIVKHLARLHGGEASVNSKLGEGTVFTIELPSY